MSRPTKSEIERLLLTGDVVAWTDTNQRPQTLQLSDPAQRRLLAYLLKSNVRGPTGLPADFITGLEAAYDSPEDPASTFTSSTGNGLSDEPWRLYAIEAEGFGGLNTWKGSAFEFQLECQSYLLEGPNGSGKSSLIGAILWALTGERPRDQSDVSGHEARPVFSAADKPVGVWPPIACYPAHVADLNSGASVRVRLTFRSSNGDEAVVERKMTGGLISETRAPDFRVPTVLIDTGLVMPARLVRLRLDEGRGRLTDAVQTLTGLDDLISIGLLVEGLCHKSREYRAFRAKDLASLKQSFEQALANARAALVPVGVNVPGFAPADTDSTEGTMAALGKSLNDRAAQLAQVVSSDLAPNLDLATARVQNDVVVALANARSDIAAGLKGLETWASLETIEAAIDETTAAKLEGAVSQARSSGEEALSLLRKSKADSRFQLKVIAARWHAEHVNGPVRDCPLCERELTGPGSLASELEVLRSAGAAAAKTFDDNVNAILAVLENAVPVPLRKLGESTFEIDPQSAFVSELRGRFVTQVTYAGCLIRAATLVEAALQNAPPEGLAAVEPAAVTGEIVLSPITTRVAEVSRLIEIARWFRRSAPEWINWWHDLTTGGAGVTEAHLGTDFAPIMASARSEPLLGHLDRLSDALSKSEPYRKGAEAMRLAWKMGREAWALEKEIAKRDSIAEMLAPLKSLGGLCESVTRDAIDGLSGRIASLLGRILLTEQLQFKRAGLDRKEGLVVRAGFAPDLRIDATLVANTSWLRAVLWCFVFALREEAVAQLGHDPFPVMIFDDPQATFDVFHRARWAHYIASLQNGPAQIQIIVTTYEEGFLDLLRADGVTGRQALVTAPGVGCDHVSILEGAALERAWTNATLVGTPAAAVEYLNKVRVYLEGLLKLMLRGEEADIPKMVVGNLRDLLARLRHAGKAPWDRPVFATLLAAIKKGRAEVNYIEGAHHTTGRSYGMGEAADVEQHWSKTLGPTLDKAFRTVREYRLLHGGMRALYAPPSVVTMPSGYSDKVSAIPLRVLGRAAALSDGHVADGSIDMNHFGTAHHVAVTLGKHSAYRLSARTLEPVARPGDILITRDYGDTSNRSLVVALNEDRLLARRFEISANFSDVAVLTAQAINPREIAPPVIAHRGTLTLHKVVGVLFASHGRASTTHGEQEICDCGGEAELGYLTADALGLVEVDGQSAEPLALHGQYLIVRSPTADKNAVRTFDGKPVIAEDSNGAFYFKRLRANGDQGVILESLDSGGDYPPVVLDVPGGAGNALKQVWPVAGVLFEIPN